MQAMSVSQKFRSSIETSSDKVALKDGQKILQESIEATEGIVEATLDTEIDHLRLKESLQALLKTTMAFRDLLYHVAPKAKPTPKEDKKIEATAVLLEAERKKRNVFRMYHVTVSRHIAASNNSRKG